MYRANTAMPIKVRREGRRTTTIQANVSDECLGLLSITTRNGEGWWAPIVGGQVVTVFRKRQMPANDFGIAQDFPYVVDGGKMPTSPRPSSSRRATSARWYAATVRTRIELVGYFADIAANVLG
jgi:hypothetical protein